MCSKEIFWEDVKGKFTLSNGQFVGRRVDIVRVISNCTRHTHEPHESRLEIDTNMSQATEELSS